MICSRLILLHGKRDIHNCNVSSFQSLTSSFKSICVRLFSVIFERLRTRFLGDCVLSYMSKCISIPESKDQWSCVIKRDPTEGSCRLQLVDVTITICKKIIQFDLEIKETDFLKWS